MKMPTKTCLRSRRYSGSICSAGRRSTAGAGLRKENIAARMLAEPQAARQWQVGQAKEKDANSPGDAMGVYEAISCPPEPQHRHLSVRPRLVRSGAAQRLLFSL